MGLTGSVTSFSFVSQISRGLLLWEKQSLCKESLCAPCCISRGFSTWLRSGSWFPHSVVNFCNAVGLIPLGVLASSVSLVFSCPIPWLGSPRSCFWLGHPMDLTPCSLLSPHHLHLLLHTSHHSHWHPHPDPGLAAWVPTTAPRPTSQPISHRCQRGLSGHLSTPSLSLQWSVYLAQAPGGTQPVSLLRESSPEDPQCSFQARDPFQFGILVPWNPPTPV